MLYGVPYDAMVPAALNHGAISEALCHKVFLKREIYSILAEVIQQGRYSGKVASQLASHENLMAMLTTT